MKLEDFSYFLPDDLIAQHPRPQRDASRMMLLDRRESTIEDLQFSSLPDFLQKGDVLVINDSRVIPARIYGKKTTGSIIEILLITCKEKKDGAEWWEVMARPGKRINENDLIDLGHSCEARVVARMSDKKWLMAFNAEDGFENYLKCFGRAPLPPYIKRRKNTAPEQSNDRERYQTIYAKTAGSIAAPTAGLHFSPQVLETLKSRGVGIAAITLHVGIGTFWPIETDIVENHVMQTEYFEITPDTADTINNARRVIAAGTTTTRTLESVADNNGHIMPQSGETSLFIYPGYTFKRVNGLLTNFHLPRSSLFLLVCAFAGTDFVKKAYARAVKNRYLFYSYGDCMLIL
ncbi:MAG: S-adenosylmethionine:tRNA ribosyltransferase-isomerase [Deltaproteobacteria bacterium ADurb.Bin151]|nr:tRNA preQ1(34) S-adenosylmethionine ribosyltransferase-isomerase QueA [Smithella sp.]OQB50532.1 MAG: S-adenosylmethionine:tRNA ribosyltransferase-isomerase [Deltaproteobacteria bacterium ADurb.Bin151]